MLYWNFFAMYYFKTLHNNLVMHVCEDLLIFFFVGQQFASQIENKRCIAHLYMRQWGLEFN
jgi:hypothetical protein